MDAQDAVYLIRMIIDLRGMLVKIMGDLPNGQAARDEYQKTKPLVDTFLQRLDARIKLAQKE